MRVRAIFLDAVVFLLWALICFFSFGVFGLNIPLSSLGVAFGLGFGVAVALKQISSIERKGEFRVRLKTLALALLTGIILVSIVLCLLFSLGPEAGIQMLSFIYPSVPATYAAITILYFSWERKHKRLILSDGVKVYAVPTSGGG